MNEKKHYLNKGFSQMKPNKKIILFSAIATAIIIAAVFLLFASPSEWQVYAEIEKANYCSIDDDCTIVSFGCPFGCGSYLNKNAGIANLQSMVSSYQATHLQCEYRCMMPPVPVCRQGICVPKICEINKEFANPVEFNGSNALACECPSASKFEGTYPGTQKCVPDPDFTKMQEGERIGLHIDLSQEREAAMQSVEQAPLLPCKNSKVPGFSFGIFYDKRFVKPITVCYKEKVDCPKNAYISGTLKKHETLCGKGASPEELCTYYYIEADSISCYD